MAHAMFGVSIRWRRAMAVCGASALLVALACLALAHARVVFAPTSPFKSDQDVSFGPHSELVLVHTVSRHGQRTPADTFPTDIHINETFFPFGWGSLTNVGRMQMYKLGALLRARYNKFLGEVYTEDAIRAQSTGASRTRMSCALTMAGLWPPGGTLLEWNPLLDWQPIPIVSQELEDDTLLLVRKRCPRYEEALEEVMNSTNVQSELEDNAQLLQELTEMSGLRIANYHDVLSLYSTLRAEEVFGLDLVPWSKQYYPREMISFTEKSFIINTYTDELVRLKGGVLLKSLMSDWISVTSGKARPRITVYNGHDSTVANLARALGVWEPQIPDYGITLLLELHRDTETKQYYLEIYLQNSTRVEPFQLTIPGCTERCPLDKVVSLRKHVTPVDWESECLARNPEYEPPPPAPP